MVRPTGTGPGLEARILVVDDEEDIASALQRLLTLAGYAVDTAASGEEAIEALAQASYDAAVVDIRLPGMDGVELARLALQDHPNLHVVFLTGYATLDSAIDAVRIHAADYLLKPVSGDEVARAISAALRQRDAGAVQLDSARVGRLRVGPLSLDPDRRIATLRSRGGAVGQSALLTQSEAGLLQHLMVRPGSVVSYRELAGAVLRYDVGQSEAAALVRPHVSRLRAKLGLAEAWPDLLRTIRGNGYSLQPEPPNAREDTG